MATRRQGREWALQMLFQADMNPGVDIDMAIPKFWRQQWTCKIEDAAEKSIKLKPKADKRVEDRVAPPKIREFTERLVRGVMGHLDEIDDKLVSYTQNWPLHRMGSVERNVLRLAFYELMYCDDVPAAVVINEAIDLAKYFSNTDAGRFVNGILDRLNKDLHPTSK
jgi:N utilization substance protein B